MDEPYAQAACNLSQARRQRGLGEDGDRSLSASYDGVMEQSMGLPFHTVTYWRTAPAARASHGAVSLGGFVPTTLQL
jgi:hypothetical protein